MNFSFNKHLLMGFSLLFLTTSLLAQTINHEPLATNTPVDEILKGSMIEFNEKILLNRFHVDGNSNLAYSHNYVDGRINPKANIRNQTYCYFYANMDPRNYELPRISWRKIISEKYGKVTATTTNDDWYYIHFEISEHAASTYDRDFTLACYMGLGTWIANENGKMQIKNIYHNLGNRITFLQGYAQQEIARQ